MVRFNDKKQATELSPEDILIMTDVSDSDSDKKVTMNQMATYVADIVPSNLPSQAGHSGQYLKTDGTAPSWADVQSLPSQTGQAGKYLYSDGTDATWRSSYTPPLLSFGWYDHKLNDIRFLRADTFSWQDGTVYNGVYQKLLGEWNNDDSTVQINADKTGSPTVSNKGIVSGFSTENYLSKSITLGSTKEEIFPIVFDFQTGTDVTTEQSIFQIGTWCVYLKLLNNKLYLSLGDGTAWNIVDSQEGTSALTANTAYEVEINYDGTNYTLVLKTNSETPTIVTDITFASSQLICTGVQQLNIGITSGHANPFLGQIDVSACSINNSWHGIFGKISPNDFIILDSMQEQYAIQKFTNESIAWYYILDKTNHRFKLPRMKYLASVKSSATVPVVGNGMGLGLTDGTNNYGMRGRADNYVITGQNAYGKTVGSTFGAETTTGVVLGVTTDPTKSGMVADLANAVNAQTLDYMYLYFYVGDYTQDAIEQTAGLNAELFNEKVDKSDLQLCHVVVSTYKNGTSWYRIYDDGWCEQGGRYTIGTNGSGTITFLKEFVDTSYTIFNSKESTDSSNWNVMFSDLGTRTTSQIVIKANLTGYTLVGSWEACGYLVEGEY